MRALSPEHATQEECSLVRSRLLGTSTQASEKRQRLARAVGRAADVPEIEGAVVVRLREAGHREQANEVVAARAFGAILDRSRDAVANLTRAVEPGRGGVKLATLVSDSALRKSIKDLRAAALNYLEKAISADVVFWVMKTSSTIKIRKPAARNDHRPAVRVNFTADSGGVVSKTGGVIGGWSGETDGSMLMWSCLPSAA